MVFGAYFDGESSKDENQYLQGWMEIPFPSCLEELGCFSFLLISAVGVLYLMPESLLRRPYSGALSLFLKKIYFTEMENQRNGPGVSHAQLGILHPPHDCAPSSNTLEP